jgi:hypothetical protein
MPWMAFPIIVRRAACFKKIGYGRMSAQWCPAFAGQAENKGVENFFA